MRQWQANLLGGALLSAIFLSPALLALLFPWSYTLGSFNKLAAPFLFPGRAAAEVFGQGSMDAPLILFASWVFYGVVFWPLAELLSRR